MERFYDGDQEKLFSEAHVVNPFAKVVLPAKSAKKDARRGGPSLEECEVSTYHVFNFHSGSSMLIVPDMFIFVTFICDVWA